MIGFRNLFGLNAAILISLIIILTICPSAGAVSTDAYAYCLVDLPSGQVLAGSRQYQPLPPASTTKIMTALLALEYLELDEYAQASEKAQHTPPTAIGIKKGQKMKVRDLLTAALLISANDACVVLAEKVAGSEEVFTYLMNKKAFLLGANKTYFVNSNGLPGKGHVSSCYDLFLITRAALKEEFFAQTVAKTSATINHPAYPRGKKITNTNQLLQMYPGAVGVKTGTTDAAGKCLVGMVSRDDRKLISVVLRARDRYYDTIALMDYGLKGFKRVKVVDKTQVFKTLRVADGTSDKVEIYPERSVVIWLPQSKPSALEKKVKINYRPAAPIKKGEILGVLEVYYNGSMIDKIRLISARSVNAIPRGCGRLFNWDSIN